MYRSISLIALFISIGFKRANSLTIPSTLIDVGRPECESFENHENYQDLQVDPRECGFGFTEVLQESAPRGRIYGGEQTVLGEFPWIVELNVEHYPDGVARAFKGPHFYPAPDPLTYTIIGTLITSRHILTTATALCGNTRGLDAFWAKVTARLGVWKTGNIDNSPTGYKADNGTDCQGEDINVLKRRCAPPVIEVDCPYDQVREHPEQDPIGHNNIVMLRMARHINFNDYIRPICIPWSCDIRSANLIDRKLYTVGWGNTRTTTFARDILRKVELKGIANRDCRAAYADTDRVGPRGIYESEQCAVGWRSPADGPCTGDKGGPLMMQLHGKWYVMGIRAFGHVCGGGFPRPLVFDYLPSFMSWMLDSTFDH